MPASEPAIAFLSTPIGALRLTATEHGITSALFVEQAGAPLGRSASLDDALGQLQEYFDGKRQSFHDLPLVLVGSDFTRNVWDEVLAVPYGATRTYGQLAERLGKGAATQAVGSAVGRNQIAIIIPCHRIVPAGGMEAGAYAWGAERKQWLLGLERGSKT